MVWLLRKSKGWKRQQICVNTQNRNTCETAGLKLVEIVEALNCSKRADMIPPSVQLLQMCLKQKLQLQHSQCCPLTNNSPLLQGECFRYFKATAKQQFFTPYFFKKTNYSIQSGNNDLNKVIRIYKVCIIGKLPKPKELTLVATSSGNLWPSKLLCGSPKVGGFWSNPPRPLWHCRAGSLFTSLFSLI